MNYACSEKTSHCILCNKILNNISFIKEKWHENAFIYNERKFHRFSLVFPIFLFSRDTYILRKTKLLHNKVRRNKGPIRVRLVGFH